MTLLTSIGIIFCISQSAIFSGLNLAVFSVSKLRLEVESSAGDKDAKRVLALRKNSNLLLTTILWGNVGANVLLAQLANSVLAGVAAFLFSTILITFAGEILPQAYFSRNALRIASILSPLLRAYTFLLYPLAKPSAWVLDRLLGAEKTSFLSEHTLRELITLHALEEGVDIDHFEGTGALNFLSMDDLPVMEEGEIIDSRSILQLEFRNGVPVFPISGETRDDAFFRMIDRSGRKWIILVDNDGEPQFVLNADGFLRDAVFGNAPFDPQRHCHRPIVVRTQHIPLGETISQLRVFPMHAQDDVIDEDIIVYWGSEKRIITGSDILGRLLRGIVTIDGTFPTP